MEHRHTSPLVFKNASLEENGLFTGYASTFEGPPDSYGDVVAPGAFAKSIQFHREQNTVPAMLWAHDMQEPIGRWIELAEDAKGLRVTGKFTLGTKRGSEAYELAKDNAIAMSIGFRLKDFSDQGNIRRIQEADLVEISLVALPANSAARILEVKSRPENVRDFEALLRDVAGYTRLEAKRLAAGGWAALTERDVRTEGREVDASVLLDLKKQIESAIQSIQYKR